jgi:hypothetical protein
MSAAVARSIADEQIVRWLGAGWTAEMAWRALNNQTERNNASWDQVRDFMRRWLITEYGAANFKLAA